MSSPTWQQLPALRGSDSVTSLAATNRALFAGNPGGLFRQGEGGRWHRLSLPATEIQAILAADSPDFLAAGAGSFVDVSRDGGATWDRTELDPAARVTCLSMTGRDLLAGTDRAGIFVSANGGASWRAAGLEGQMVLAVCGSDLAGTDQGLWRRGGEDALGAMDWRKLAVEGVVTAIARSGSAIVAGTEDQGLFRSTDDGKSWQPCPGTGEGINALASDGSRFAAVTSNGQVFLSEGAAASWKELPALGLAPIAVALQGDSVCVGCYRAGFLRLSGGEAWKPENEGLQTTNVLDMLVTPEGLIVVATDGLWRLTADAWSSLEGAAPGEPRAAGLREGQLLLATDQGLFEGNRKIADFRDVTMVRTAPNGDLALLTEEQLQLLQGGSWRASPLSPKEKAVNLAFSPSYPDDDSLLMATVRQGTRTSIVRYETKAQSMDRLFDFDARSRWVSFDLPPGYRVDVRRPASFFAGTGNFIFRPVWPGQDWQRDVIHDSDATVLAVVLSPRYPRERVVLVGTTSGVLSTENDGLLWVN
ncbi:MAG: hypothetical protein KGJ86_06530, partial [Chloroflexota bacterium]|nr:hypothetical protein [Chloroflexota bacterium]